MVDGLIVRLVFFAMAVPVFGVMMAVSKFFAPATPVCCVVSPNTVTVDAVCKGQRLSGDGLAFNDHDVGTRGERIDVLGYLSRAGPSWREAPSSNPAVPGPLPLSKVTPPVAFAGSAPSDEQLNTGGPPAEAI